MRHSVSLGFWIGLALYLANFFAMVWLDTGEIPGLLDASLFGIIAGLGMMIAGYAAEPFPDWDRKQTGWGLFIGTAAAVLIRLALRAAGLDV